MIKIRRTAAPDILLSNPDPSLKTYADIEVRRSLSAMQHRKCCYCEKIIDLCDIFPDDDNLVNGSHVEKHVEHFRPKGKEEYRHLTNDWTNLLLACNTCNMNKGQKFEVNQDGDPLCIDPSNPDIDPEDHIMLRERDEKKIEPDGFEGRLIPRNDSVFGEWTINNVRLNESTSRKDRWEKICEIIKDITDYRHELREKIRQHRLGILREHCSPEAEYAFVARELYRQYNIPE